MNTMITSSAYKLTHEPWLCAWSLHFRWRLFRSYDLTALYKSIYYYY